MKKIFILIFSCCFFAGCSEQEIIESVNDSNEPQPRATSDIFKLTEVFKFTDINPDYELERGVDNEGNFYWIDSNNQVFKYDFISNETILFAPYEGLIYPGYFCFDENNNFCHIVVDDNNDEKNYYLRRITSDGRSISDQRLNLPDIPVPSWYWPYKPYGICAAPNGNIFILLHGDLGNLKCYRLSTNGIFTELGMDLSMISYQSARISLMKASGGTQYIVSTFDPGYWKLNPNTLSLEHLDSELSLHFMNCTAGSGKGNLYALDGRKVVQLRPNATSNLVIGTIPDKYYENGRYVTVGEPEEIYMNADGSVFYIVAYCPEENSEGGAPYIIYRMTL